MIPKNLCFSVCINNKHTCMHSIYRSHVDMYLRRIIDTQHVECDRMMMMLPWLLTADDRERRGGGKEGKQVWWTINNNYDRYMYMYFLCQFINWFGATRWVTASCSEMAAQVLFRTSHTIQYIVCEVRKAPYPVTHFGCVRNTVQCIYHLKLDTFLCNTLSLAIEKIGVQNSSDIFYPVPCNKRTLPSADGT